MTGAVPDELAEARRVVKQHQGYGCPECTPTGCAVELEAALVVFDAVAKSWPAGPKTLDDIRMFAEEVRGVTDEQS